MRPGLERDVEGLTLIEAASVGGETLAVDALANALAQVFRAEPHPDRVAVAMSGGVDSAVALLRAGRHALGVTLRLWMDPAGPDGERACCSPSAVIAARATCHERGLPHVTLDLREEFRRAIVGPFIRGYARGETPNPCIACNGSFRFAELLAFAERAGAARLATGHYARIVRRGDRLLLARAVDDGKDQSYMLARLDPRFLDRLWFPLGDQTKEETRAEAERAGLAAARRADSQEACFLAGDDYRTFLERHGLPASSGPIVDEDGPRARNARRLLALHAGTAARSRRRGSRAALRGAHERGHEHRRRRSARGARDDERSARAAASTPTSAAPRRSFATARRRFPQPSSRAKAASCSSSTSPPTASRRARPRCSTTTVQWSAPAWFRRLARCSPTVPAKSSTSPLRSS